MILTPVFFLQLETTLSIFIDGGLSRVMKLGGIILQKQDQEVEVVKTNLKISLNLQL